MCKRIQDISIIVYDVIMLCDKYKTINKYYSIIVWKLFKIIVANLSNSFSDQKYTIDICID